MKFLIHIMYYFCLYYKLCGCKKKEWTNKKTPKKNKTKQKTKKERKNKQTNKTNKKQPPTYT